MKKTILLLLIVILSSCKTKQVTKKTGESKETTEAVSTKTEQKNEQKTEQKTETKKAEISKNQKDQETNIEITGTAETDKPLEIHTVKNGDTLESFKVTGNAQVIYKSKATSTAKSDKETTSNTLQTKLENLANNIVNEGELKTKAKEFQETAKEVSTTTGTFWSFGLLAVWGTVALVIVGLFIYFKKGK